MVNLDSFTEFLISQGNQISIYNIVISLLIAAGLSYILSLLYVRFGKSISNRRRFANNFILLSVTIALIISVVKSSLALSLGLVGALSIVRFRTPIKDPEELTFLFINIAIGLGVGANHWLITTVAFAIIAILILFRYFTNKKERNENLIMNISGKIEKKLSIRKITNILESHCTLVHLKRFDNDNKNLDSSFVVHFTSFNNLEKARKELSELSSDMKISYFDLE